MSTSRGRPPRGFCLAGGIIGPTMAHCSSVRSDGYFFRDWFSSTIDAHSSTDGICANYLINLLFCQVIFSDSLSERGANNLREVEKALQELLAKKILMRYETEILRGKRNKVIDAKYTLHPDMGFINEARKANSRALKLGDIWSQRRTMLVEGRPRNPQTGHSEEQV